MRAIRTTAAATTTTCLFNTKHTKIFMAKKHNMCRENKNINWYNNEIIINIF